MLDLERALERASRYPCLDFVRTNLNPPPSHFFSINSRPRLSAIHWSHIIIDEGHRLKNAKCKLNAELRAFTAEHRLLLTGTPLQNDILELWSLLNFLLPDLFDSQNTFQEW